MFIPRQVYQDVYDKATRAEAIVAALTQHNITLTANMDWMKIRLTEMSLERAAMLKRYLNIEVPVASFEEERVPFSPDETMSFADVGDEAAAKLGIGWTSDGVVEYATK